MSVKIYVGDAQECLKKLPDLAAVLGAARLWC